MIKNVDSDPIPGGADDAFVNAFWHYPKGDALALVNCLSKSVLLTKIFASSVGYYWKIIAQIQCSRGNKSAARATFNKSANFYLKAADKMPEDDPHHIGMLCYMPTQERSANSCLPLRILALRFGDDARNWHSYENYASNSRAYQTVVP